MHLLFWIAAGLVLVALVVAGVVFVLMLSAIGAEVQRNKKWED